MHASAPAADDATHYRQPKGDSQEAKGVYLGARGGLADLGQAVDVRLRQVLCVGDRDRRAGVKQGSPLIVKRTLPSSSPPSDQGRAIHSKTHAPVRSLTSNTVDA